MKSRPLEDIRGSTAFMREEEESDVLKVYSEIFVLSPRHWNACALPMELEWEYHKFDPANTEGIPDDYGGVYTFVVKPEIVKHPLCSYLFYVGKAERQSFRSRYTQYLRTKVDAKTKWRHIRRMLNYWDGHLWFCYARIDQQDLITAIEQALQDAYIPPYNKEFRGEAGPAVRILR